MRDEGLWGRCQRLPKLEISESPWGRLGVCSLFTTLAGLAARPHTAAAWIHRAAAWVTYGCSLGYMGLPPGIQRVAQSWGFVPVGGDMVTLPLLARNSPCGHPPLQKPTRLLRVARGESPSLDVSNGAALWLAL